MTSPASGGELPDYAPVPRSALGPPFTAPTAFTILESIRLDLGYRMDVHP